MAFTVPYLGGERGATITCNEFPNECPFCHRSISPNQISSLVRGLKAEVFMYCPVTSCLSSFIAYYEYQNYYQMYIYTGRVTKGNLIKRSFPDIINLKSPQFSIIYNESSAAEQEELKEICGVGYRKALEFLIKDYCVSLHPDKKDIIERKLLGGVLQDYVTDPKVKKVAQRATWLGNDETHYIRKWEGKNLQDLKALIELTLHWIEAEELTKTFEEEMPA